MFQKMIKCCTEAGYHTHAFILCQFLSDSDYSTAFRAIEEKSNVVDAMDSLYQFVWDTTLLEYIVNMHTKRGELSKKKKSLEHMKMECQVYNPDFNRQEGQFLPRTPKNKFLRSLAKLFL